MRHSCRPQRRYSHGTVWRIPVPLPTPHHYQNCLTYRSRRSVLRLRLMWTGTRHGILVKQQAYNRRRRVRPQPSCLAFARASPSTHLRARSFVHLPMESLWLWHRLLSNRKLRVNSSWQVSAAMAAFLACSPCLDLLHQAWCKSNLGALMLHQPLLHPNRRQSSSWQWRLWAPALLLPWGVCLHEVVKTKSQPPSSNVDYYAKPRLRQETASCPRHILGCSDLFRSLPECASCGAHRGVSWTSSLFG
jgi:hypothetical protein